VIRLQQYSHKLTQGLKVSFRGPVRGKFSVNIKMNDFVRNTLQSKFHAYFSSCYQVQAYADSHIPICGAALLLQVSLVPKRPKCVVH